MSSPDTRAASPIPRTSDSAPAVHPHLPPVLSRLLRAPEGEARDAAWAEFIAEHTGLLLHTCRSLTRHRDAAMDGYAFVLDALREEGCQRLRAYVPDPRTRFTTWLVVVARRLLLDHQRHRYGRPRSQDESHRAEHAARRRLEDLVAAELDPDELTSAARSPDAALLEREVAHALDAAVGALEPGDRLLLALRFDDERPVREIAAMLGLPSVFHVYRRLGGVLAGLRRALGERGVDAAEP